MPARHFLIQRNTRNGPGSDGSPAEPGGPAAPGRLRSAPGEAIESENHIRRPRIERRIQALTAHLKAGLAAIPKVRLHTNTGTALSAGLTAFSIPGGEPAAIVDHVREKYNIVVRTIGDKASHSVGVRVSTHVWITRKDIDLLLQGIDELARRT